MIITSWNVNGIRAVFRKGFPNQIKDLNSRVICLQETKIQEDQLSEEMTLLPGYRSYWSSAERRGYSGTAVYIKEDTEILDIKTEFAAPELNGEGRIIQVDTPAWTLFNVYFPNGQKDDERLNYKLRFYEALFQYTDDLAREGKKIIICGDYNTAHKPIDLANPKENEKRSGFLPIEREWLDKIMARGYRDCFRIFHQEGERYTWWTYRFKARERNVGWRIDYFFVTENMVAELKNCKIHESIMGSDHCPVTLEIR